jgi:hypothetical protein
MSSPNRGAAAAQSIEVLEPNARFKEACRYQHTMRQKVIYLDSPMRPMVFMPTHPGPWAVHTNSSCYAQLKSYVFDVECQIALYEAMQTDPERHTEAVLYGATRQIYILREFLGRCNRDLVAFASAGLDYDSLPADWDCIWNDQMMTWVACDHGKPIGEGDRDAVSGSAAINVIDLMAALRRSIAEDDKAKPEPAPQPEKSKSTKAAAPKASRTRAS